MHIHFAYACFETIRRVRFVEVIEALPWGVATGQNLEVLNEFLDVIWLRGYEPKLIPKKLNLS